MERIRVRSSNLRSIGYLELDQLLEVEFLTGSIYQYFNVPSCVYEALMNARSHGSYLNANIKDHYRYRQLA